MAGTLRLQSPDGAEVLGAPAASRGLSSAGGRGALSGRSLGASGSSSALSLEGPCVWGGGAVCGGVGLSLDHTLVSAEVPVSPWTQLQG